MNAAATLQATVLLTCHDDSVAVIELANPPVNALGEAVRHEFCAVLDRVAEDVSLRAVVLSARGSVFCSGDDLKEAATCADRPRSIRSFHSLFSRIENLKVPVIAAINGACAGGGLELALCCDIRIASVNAKFIASGVNVGLLGSAVRLSRLIGISRAKAMLLSGLAIDAEEARASGLVASLGERDVLLDAALRLARRIATRAPLSVQAVKRVTGTAAMPDAAAREAEELLALAATRDHREAVEAFAAGRAPEFTEE